MHYFVPIMDNVNIYNASFNYLPPSSPKVHFNELDQSALYNRTTRRKKKNGLNCIQELTVYCFVYISDNYAYV